MSNLYKITLVSMLVFGAVFMASPLIAVAQTTAQTDTGGFSLNIFDWLFGSSASSYDPVISIVQVPGTDEVYRIVSGQKHLIPTNDIFLSYGYSSRIIKPMTAADLARYPFARLFQVTGDESGVVYYLTDNGSIRPMLNDDVFFSYGNRKEDIILITQKEFNFYPRNQFVYVNAPYENRDVFQIVGGVKRFVTPMALKRMKIKDFEVMPINITEFDAYPPSAPIIF
jgi:hypothetical protein